MVYRAQAMLADLQPAEGKRFDPKRRLTDRMSQSSAGGLTTAAAAVSQPETLCSY